MERARNSDSETHVKRLNWTSRTDLSGKLLCCIFFGTPCRSCVNFRDVIQPWEWQVDFYEWQVEFYLIFSLETFLSISSKKAFISGKWRVKVSMLTDDEGVITLQKVWLVWSIWPPTWLTAVRSQALSLTVVTQKSENKIPTTNLSENMRSYRVFFLTGSTNKLI